MKSVFDIVVDFEKSQGSELFDAKSGKYYLDLFSMFSSLPLGYNHSIFDEGFNEEIQYLSRVKMSNNLFQTKEFQSFERDFRSISLFDNLHFCSTGALAVESAIKCAYEYSKESRSIVVSAINGFHGINSWGFTTDRTMASVRKRVECFPVNDWVCLPVKEIPDYVSKNHDKITAVIVELVQCTAGDIYLDKADLSQIEDACVQNDVCFIVDEIQTGFGVSGEMWYSKKIGITPDIVVFGKKSQISGIMTNDKYAGAINSEYRKLQVTFDGDLIDAVRAKYIIKAIDKHSLMDNVLVKSDLIRNQIGDFFENYRSSGFLIAFDFIDMAQRDKFAAAAFQKGLLVNPTGERSVRVRPNLALSSKDLEGFIGVVKDILSEW